jgi:hypothetical protein
MTDFNLHALVRDVCDHIDEADPAILAKAVNHRIFRADRDAALEQALEAYVRRFVSRDRHPVTPSGHGTYAAQSVSAAGGSSAKVAGIREAWRKMLRARLPVGDGPDPWKFLADCTVANLNYAAQVREDQARHNAESAQRLRVLAAHLQRHGVDTVSELPEDVLASVLGDES